MRPFDANQLEVSLIKEENALRHQISKSMKLIWSYLKSYLRWFILGGTLFFLGKATKDHWQEVAAIRIDIAGWGWLAIALCVTLLAHTWAGWVWGWILWGLNQPVKSRWAIQIYLQTNIAKYLPGNVWHYYSRVGAVTATGASWGTASLSILLEPLLMAAAALIVTLVGLQQSRIYSQFSWHWQLLSLIAVLLAIHPRILNPVIQLFSRLKRQANSSNPVPVETLHIKQYPLVPLLGELGFLGLRGAGFLFTLLAFSSIATSQIPLLLGAFSFSWLLGLIVPGAPGGLGVFEATAIALLNQNFSPGLMLSTVTLYRLISILAEAIGAGLAWLDTNR
jgi:hypothetical protein